MIKSAGNRISPTELEEAAQAVPDVAEAIALGIPDERLGQAVLLLVRLSSGADEASTLDALRNHLKHELPNFMMPRDIRVVAALPRNPHGKIDRPALLREWSVVAEDRPA